MAKDGTNRGGARVGSGRKRKPLSERILDGGTAHRKTKVLPEPAVIIGTEFSGEDMPPPSEWLKDETKNTQRKNQAAVIYAETWQWLKERKCEHLITKRQIEQYAAAVARYIQCEDGINTFGF